MSDSPATVLRQAAARVRETGTACEPSVISLRGVPWHTEVYAVDLSARAVAQSAPSMDERARFGRYIAEAESPELAAWIALMHTGLAEPLAAWLEHAARSYEAHLTAADQVWAGADEPGLRERDEFIAAGPSGHAEALAVAHIILGTTKETTA